MIKLSKPSLEEVSVFIAVAVGATSAAFATPLWLNARYPEWAKLFFVVCAVTACVLPVSIRRRPQNVWALYGSVALTTICMASLVFGLYLYVPALVAMLVAAEFAAHTRRLEEGGG